jgi:hypothetical protein
MGFHPEALGELVGALGLGGITAEIRATAIPGVVRISAQQAAGAASGPSVIGPLLRPSIIIRGGDGAELAHLEPNGAPPAWTGWAVVVGVPLALLVLGFVLGRAL